MPYTFTLPNPAYGDTGGFNSILVNENKAANLPGPNYDDLGNVSSNGASARLSYVGQNAGQAAFEVQTGGVYASLAAGLHEFYIRASILVDDTGASNNAVGGLLYVDSAQRGHNATLGGYAAATNTFSVTLAAVAADAAFGTGGFTVTGGDGFTTTASLTGQTISGGMDTLVYTLAARPTVAGTYNVYATGYDVASDGLASTPTLAVTLPVNTAPTLSGAHASTTDDRTADALFSGVTVSDPDSGQTQTATLSFAAANGALSGAGTATVANGVATYTLQADSASALTAALHAVTFKPTAAPAGTPATATTVAVALSDGLATTGPDSRTVVTATHTTDTPPVLAGTHASTTSDTAADLIFSGVTVTDPDIGQTETAQISFKAADGVLTGAGQPNVAGGTATYNLSAPSAATLTALLQAISFQPTAGAAGATDTVTPFSLTVGDGAIFFGPDVKTVVTATHPPPPPPQIAVSGTHAYTVSLGSTIRLFDSVVVTDSNATGNLNASFLFQVANAGVVDGYDSKTSANGVDLYFISATTPQALTDRLHQVTFTPALAPSQGSVKTYVTLVVRDLGASLAQASDSSTTVTTNRDVVIAPSTADPVVVLATQNLQANITAYANLTQTTPAVYRDAQGHPLFFNSDGTAFTLPNNTGDAASAAQTLASAIAARLANGSPLVTYTPQPSSSSGATTTGVLLVNSGQSAGTLTLPSSVPIGQQTAIGGFLSQTPSTDTQFVFNAAVAGTTSVANLSYAFFTGLTPTRSGLQYLLDTSQNPASLYSAYYNNFNTANRYINFAVSLAKGGDPASTAAYHAAYDGLSLVDAAAKAYSQVFGFAASSDKISQILNGFVPDGMGGQETRAQYFAQYGGDGPNGAGTKAALIGWLLADSVQEGFGQYQQANANFLADLAHGTAAFNVDLVATYASRPTFIGPQVSYFATGH